MKKDNNILKHILENITDINNFSKDISFTAFIDNSLIRKGICMSLINIGELSKSLSKEFKAENNSIPWKNIAGLRDITAHKYHTLNLEIVWQVVKVDPYP